MAKPGILLTIVVAAGVILSARQAPAPVFTVPPAGTSRVQAAPRDRVDAAVVARELAGMRLDRIFPGGGDAAASRIGLNLFEETYVAAFERLDVDQSGHRSWVGRIIDRPQSHVSITERDGIVSGLIDAGGVVYQVRTMVRGLYVLEQVETSRLGTELEPMLPPVPPSPRASRAAAVPAPADTSAIVDVLMLYTPAVRTASGGTGAIAALISRIISDSNTAYEQSGVEMRIRLAGSTEVPYTESTSGMALDLSTLANSELAHAYRDQSGADLVQLLVHNPEDGVCGVGYLMTPAFFSQAFAPFAYSVADWRCAAVYSPTHELAHNMGSHHAPEDGASGALFSYSYGYKSPTGAFRTVMAYDCPGGCPRVARFSNPSGTYQGSVTGSATQNNALSIAQAAGTVAGFRQAIVPGPSPTPPPGATPPSAPTGLQSQVSGSTVNLSWSPSDSQAAPPGSSATSYRLDVGSAPGSLSVFSDNVGNTNAVTGSLPTGMYYWRVYALNSAGASAASAESQFVVAMPATCTAPPGPPLQFTSTVSGATVMLQWARAVSGGLPSAYTVEAGSAGGLANLVNQSVGNTLGVSVAAPPGHYYVRIRATNACGTSAASTEQLIIISP